MANVQPRPSNVTNTIPNAQDSEYQGVSLYAVPTIDYERNDGRMDISAITDFSGAVKKEVGMESITLLSPHDWDEYMKRVDDVTGVPLRIYRYKLSESHCSAEGNNNAIQDHAKEQWAPIWDPELLNIIIDLPQMATVVSVPCTLDMKPDELWKYMGMRHIEEPLGALPGTFFSSSSVVDVDMHMCSKVHGVKTLLAYTALSKSGVEPGAFICITLPNKQPSTTALSMIPSSQRPADAELDRENNTTPMPEITFDKSDVMSENSDDCVSNFFDDDPNSFANNPDAAKDNRDLNTTALGSGNDMSSHARYGFNPSSSSLGRPEMSLESRRQAPWKARRCGLSNLGNTCYMNSGLQCIIHTRPLAEYLLKHGHIDDINTTTVQTSNGKLINAMSRLVDAMWTAEDESGSSVNPSFVKNTISDLFIQFEGFQQHDCHELISHVLDGMHEDVNRIAKKQAYEVPDSDGTNDREIGEKVYRLSLTRDDSAINDWFLGQLHSLLHCPQCGRNSTKFDPSLYLPLAIPQPRTQTKPLVVCLLNVDSLVTKQSSASNLSSNVIGEGDSTKRQRCSGNYCIVVSEGKSGSAGSVCRQLQRVFESHQPGILIQIKGGKMQKVLSNDDQLYSLDDSDSYIYSYDTSYIAYYEIPESVDRNQAADSIRTALTPAKVRYSYSYMNDSDSDSEEAQPQLRVAAPMHLKFANPKDTYMYSSKTFNAPPVILFPENNAVSISNAYKSVVQYLGPFVDHEWIAAFQAAVESMQAMQVSRPSFKQSKCTSSGQTMEADAAADRDIDIEDCDARSDEAAASDDGSDSEGSPRFSADARGSLDGPGYTKEFPNSDHSEQLEEAEDDLQQAKSFMTIMVAQTVSSYQADELISGEVLDVSTGKCIVAYCPNQATLWKEPAATSSVKTDIRVSLTDCLQKFNTTETLDEDNKWYCNVCKEHVCATKKMSVWRPPQFMIIQLKRFSQTGGYYRSRLDTLVDFPLEGLDIAPFLHGDSPHRAESLLYDCYGVANHMGSASFGHYTAYCRESGSDGPFHLFDDSRVSSNPSREHIVSESAYVLFYKLRSANNSWSPSQPACSKPKNE